MTRRRRRRAGPGAERNLLAALVLVAGCGGAEDPPADGAGTGGTAGTSAAAGAGSGGHAGMPETSGKAGASSAGASSAGTSSAGTSGFAEVGVCGHRGQSTVALTEFEGYEEYFLIGEEGFGEDICVVRFDVTRVGDAPAGCPDCLWSHLVELDNPSTELDTDGVCARSELAFDMARIAELDGSRIAYGFVPEFAGHVSVLMKYDDALGAWDAFGSASYDGAALTLKFERRNGICGY